MSTWELFWVLYGELLLFGALGGVVRWGVNKEKPVDGVVGVILGAIIGLTLQPVAADWLAGYVVIDQADPGAAKRSGAFLLGVAGVWPIQFGLDWMRKRFEIKSAKEDS